MSDDSSSPTPGNLPDSDFRNLPTDLDGLMDHVEDTVRELGVVMNDIRRHGAASELLSRLHLALRDAHMTMHRLEIHTS